MQSFSHVAYHSYFHFTSSFSAEPPESRQPGARILGSIFQRLSVFYYACSAWYFKAPIAAMSRQFRYDATCVAAPVSSDSKPENFTTWHARGQGKCPQPADYCCFYVRFVILYRSIWNGGQGTCAIKLGVKQLITNAVVSVLGTCTSH
jgi:hypothetical protein